MELETYKKSVIKLRIDRKFEGILTTLSTATIYRKRGQVNARPTITGELISTSLDSGVKETTTTAKEGDYVVTNPTGKQHIIGRETFRERYEETVVSNVFCVKDYRRAFVNPFGVPIGIMTSWGELRIGDEECMITDTCDANGNNMGDEPYLIDADVFAETYAVA